MKTSKKLKSFIFSKIKFFLLAILTIFMIHACTKDKNKTHLSILMTDAPANYNEVNIDVQAVEVTGEGGERILLDANSGIYNLLEYANGATTMIATGDIEPGTIEQIRLILGHDNSVMVDSVLHPLSTPSAQQSGLKLQVHRTFEPGVEYSLTLDFDAHQSVVVKGNGQYQLKPVIRVIDNAVSGSLRGSIIPTDIIATVTAMRDSIPFSTVTNEEGKFLLSGLPAGTYNVTITPPLPLLPVTLTGKTVTVGASTDLGIIELK